MTISITITVKQVKALQRKFPGGDAAALQAKMQKFCDDWIMQYEREDDDAERRALKAAMEAATPEVQAQVKALLGV